MPLGLRVVRKMEDVFDEELQSIGCETTSLNINADYSGSNRLDMPLLMTRELWEKTGFQCMIDKQIFLIAGRWSSMGPEVAVHGKLTACITTDVDVYHERSTGKGILPRSHRLAHS